MAEYKALFDYDSFVIRFLPTSIDQYLEMKNGPSSNVDLFPTAYYSKLNRDAFTVEKLDKLSKSIKTDLVHEIFHWWQALTTPFIVSRFLISSKLLKINSGKFNLRKTKFSDPIFFIPDEHEEVVAEIYESSLMNFKHFSMSYEELKVLETEYVRMKQTEGIENIQDIPESLREKIEKNRGMNIYQILYGENHGEFNIVSDKPPVAMPVFLYPHMTRGIKYPGYAAILDYFYYIDFSADNVIEAMTYISECLYNNEDIRDLNIFEIEDHKYLGVWEFYKRLHSKNYSSMKNLAISFLALSDLALMNDPFRTDKNNFFGVEERYENSSFSYRYGKIIFRAQGFKPLEVVNNDYELSIKTFQDEFCHYCGMINPEIGLKRMILLLITVLFIDIQKYFRIQNHLEIETTIADIDRDLKENWSMIRILLDGLNTGYKNIHGKITINHKILGMILNGLFFRLENRGKLAVPHLYYDAINQMLPKPLIIYDGNYYIQSDFSEGHPYKIPYTDIESCHDFIGLHVSKKIAKGVEACDFKESGIKCWYQKNGLGCPYKRLSDKEKGLRDQLDIGSWCHWTHFLNEHKE